MPRRSPTENLAKGKKKKAPPGPGDEFALPPNWKPPATPWPGRLIRGGLIVLALALLVTPFTPLGGRLKHGLSRWVEGLLRSEVVYRDVPREVTITRDVPREVIREVVKEIPAPPPPLPSAFVPRKEVDVATLYNGITVQTHLDTDKGNYASIERGDKNAFTVEFKLKLRVPKPSRTLEELARVNPHLPTLLPGFAAMMPAAKVSGFYHKLYEVKTTRVQRDLTRLNRILDRHNFFDTETILELTHPQSKRRILLIQSDMDVVTDGSDGDRLPQMEAAIYKSTHYQPFTSYEWAKKTGTPNPLLPVWQANLANLKKEYAVKGLSAARNQELREELQQAERILAALKQRSSLIAEKDPFIVLSLLFRDYPATHPHAPGIGDYAVIIHKDKIYPAICGDYGPTFKMGEASLRVAKTINEKATPYSRPESDLAATYLIFPGTAERPFGPPNLAHWKEKVSSYLEECGGLGPGYTLHEWEDLFAPKPPPPPVAGTETAPPAPTDATVPAPAAGALPAGSPVPEKPPEPASPPVPMEGR